MPKGDDIENEAESFVVPDHLKSALNSKNRFKIRSTERQCMTARPASPSGDLDFNMHEACKQLNKLQNRTRPCIKTLSGKVLAKSRSKSPAKANLKLVPSKNSAFSYCPSVVRLELAEHYKLEAGFAVTLAKAQDCLKNSQRKSGVKPAYYMSGTHSSTAVGTTSSISSIKSTYFETEPPAKQILI